MLRLNANVDWKALGLDGADLSPASSRHRLRLILGLFAAALAIVFGRAVQLELADGFAYRQLAARPVERPLLLPAARGRIVARDGTLLAADRQTKGLALAFRYLEQPPQAQWLRGLARARLPREKRRDKASLTAMEANVRDDLAELQHRLAQLCNLSDAVWQTRTTHVQTQVNLLAAEVNQRRLANFQARTEIDKFADDTGMAAILGGLFAPPEPLPPPTVIVAEQLAHHRIIDDVSQEVIQEIESHPEDYPGVKIVEYTRRDYPLGNLASHLVGHVAAESGMPSAVAVGKETTQHPMAGMMGAELAFDDALAGSNGLEIETTDPDGNLLLKARKRGPKDGRDVILTIDARLQLAAEQALDRALRRGAEREARAIGGAIVVLDVHSGELLAAASAPRFDPTMFASGDPRVDVALADPRQPLFDRALKMAIPPGSVLKPLMALALIEDGAADPLAPFHCQGYLDNPEHFRCQLFRQQGIGHGDVTLADALAQSCNVYFFHHVANLGGPRLLEWASRFGLAEPSGPDLLGASHGQLPSAAQLRPASQTQLLAVGQGAITATPLEIVRIYAAIANGGYLVTPKLFLDRTYASPLHSVASEGAAISEATRIAGLSTRTIDAVREGLRRTVNDPNGTAYDTVRSSSVAIAGKTGTAESGGDLPDHAWFAGYVPSDAPRYAFVVVLQHGGSGATAAGPIATSLIQRMQQLGYFGPRHVAERSISPGKG